MPRRFEFQDGSSNKFWEIEQEGTAVTTQWGRIGTQGQSKTKNFETESAAHAEYAKLIGEKTRKGYVEVNAHGKTQSTPLVSETTTEGRERRRLAGSGATLVSSIAATTHANANSNATATTNAMYAVSQPAPLSEANPGRNATHNYSFDWSERTQEKCFEVLVYLTAGMPVEALCKQLELPERDIKLMLVVMKAEAHQPVGDLCAELGVNPQSLAELRKDCIVMRGMQVLAKARGGRISDKEKSYIYAMTEPGQMMALMGTKDAGYLQFQQEFGRLALEEKQRLLNEIRSGAQAAEMVANIDRQLKILTGQLQQLAHAAAAFTRVIEQAKPLSTQELSQCLSGDGLNVSEEVRDAFEKLIAEVEDKTVVPRREGPDLNVAEFAGAKTLLAMPPMQQCEALAVACNLLQLKSAGLARSKFSEALRQLILKLYKRDLPLSKMHVCTIVRAATKLHSSGSCALPVAGVVGVVERFVSEEQLEPAVSNDIERYIEALGNGPNYTLTGRRSPDNDERSAIHRLKLLLARASQSAQMILPIEPQEAWSDQAIADLRALDPFTRNNWLKLIEHCIQAKSSKPSATWCKNADKLISLIGEENFIVNIERWFALIPKKGTRATNVDLTWRPDPAEEFCPQNVDILKGLAWCCAHRQDPRLASALGDAAEACFKKVRNLGPRCPRFGNACVHALSEMNTKESVTQLSRVQSKTKHASAKAQVEKALTNAAEHSGMSVDDLQDLSIPDFGMTEVGKLVKQFGDWRAELIVDTKDGASVSWISSSGKVQQSVPAQVKTEHADGVKALKKIEDELKKLLPSLCTRVERSFVDQRHWRFDIWRERYLDHPVCGIVARRLLWNFNGRTAVWYDGKFVAEDGSHIQPDENALVELWHPIGAIPDTVLHWRRWLAERQIVQPFKQCHREIYVLTDAERETGTYSNRFAGHVVRQHQFQQLCMQRGWQYKLIGAFDSHNTPTLQLPKWNLSVELWIDSPEGHEGTTNTGIYTQVATEQVKFMRRVEGKPNPLEERMRQALGGRAIPAKFRQAVQSYSYEPVPLTEILPVVFSEVMRDVDLFVSVCSIGTDPNRVEGEHADYWNYFSFGELSNTAQTRRQVLAELIPQLNIASRCTITDKFLVVRGDLRTYKIHFASGNILMEPNDQYLCIVQSRGLGEKRENVFLPFEGDGTLSVILSKAALLADDSKITDPQILSQINHKKQSP